MGPRQNFCYCQIIEGSLMWGAVSDERSVLFLTASVGLLQRSHSWVRIPGDSWPYFTLSDSKFPQPVRPGSRIFVPQEQCGPDMSHRHWVPVSRPPTARRATVVFFKSATTWALNWFPTQNLLFTYPRRWSHRDRHLQQFHYVLLLRFLSDDSGINAISPSLPSSGSFSGSLIHVVRLHNTVEWRSRR
jgi:hypothetical protein